MILDSVFDSYRIAQDGDGKRTHSGTKTITSGSCFYQPISAELRAVTDLDLSTQAYEMLTEETDIQNTDKITIESVDYFIYGVQKKEINGQQMTNVLLYIPNN